MQKKILILLVIPSLAYANIGTDLNNLFNSFFNNDDTPIQENETSSQNKSKISTKIQDLDIPNIDIPKNPTEEDLTEIKKQIFLEESSLDDFNQRIRAQEEELWTVGNKKNSIKTQLTQLDSQIGINTNKLTYYKTLEKKWKTLLENLTRKKSIIKAETRIRQREYEKFMAKNFIRNEYFGSDDDISLIKWLFSQKKVSQILEDKSLIRNKKTEQKLRLKNLKSLTKKLEQEEIQAAFLYGKISSLHNRIAKEKINLQNFAEGKSKLLANLEQSEATLSNNLKNYHKQKNEAAIYLQNLHHTLKTTSEKLGQSYENPSKYSNSSFVKKSFFSSPLKIPLKVTAFFHDPEYKKKLGREHNAVDFFAPQGSDLIAPADGIVEKIGLNNYGYSYLILKHDNNFYTVYGHLSDIKVTKGQKIKQGELIGLTGGTPGTKGAGYFTTGPHLHFEIFKDNKFRDPLKYLPNIIN